MTLTLDHIAIAARTLDEGLAWTESLLGVTLDPGGRHDRYGTHNRLLGLGDIYLEVIAKDPGAQVDRPAWFGLDRFDGSPRPANWICRTDDLEADAAALPADPGPAQDLERGDLRWRITVPEDGSLPMDGAVPTLIQWAEGTRHPAARLPDRGLRLIRWEVLHPDALGLAAALDIDDPRVGYVQGAPGFRAVIDTPRGPVTLE